MKQLNWHLNASSYVVHPRKYLNIVRYLRDWSISDRSRIFVGTEINGTKTMLKEWLKGTGA